MISPQDRRRAQVHTAAFYAAAFAAIGAHLPFWPVWLEAWGLTPGEVGLYVSLGVAVRIVAGLALPVLADRLDRRRLVLSAGCAATAAVFAAHALIGDRALLLIATLLVGGGIAGTMPLGEALGAGAARRYGFAYAPARAAGSITFLLSNLILGVLAARLGPDVFLWWIVAFLILAAILGAYHPGGGTLAGHSPPNWGEIWRLFVEPRFALFALAGGLCLSSHAVLYAYASVHWRTLGIGDETVGALWAFSVGVEVVAMLFVAPRVLPRLGAVGAMALSGGAGILRWGVMALDPAAIWLWPLQGLHALTFVAGHLGAIAFIQAAVPDRYGASAQGALLGLSGGVLTAAAMGLAALVYPWAGGGAYLIGAAMSAAGLGLVLLLGLRWDGTEIALRATP